MSFDLAKIDRLNSQSSRFREHKHILVGAIQFSRSPLSIAFLP
jgi:hypothetical protein